MLSKRAQDPARKTAESIFKIVRFMMYRVPPKDRNRFLSRIKGKLIRISPAQLGTKKMPPSSTIGQAIGFAKNLLSGLHPSFTQKVLAELAVMLSSPTFHPPEEFMHMKKSSLSKRAGELLQFPTERIQPIEKKEKPADIIEVGFQPNGDNLYVVFSMGFPVAWFDRKHKAIRAENKIKNDFIEGKENSLLWQTIEDIGTTEYFFDEVADVSENMFKTYEWLLSQFVKSNEQKTKRAEIANQAVHIVAIPKYELSVKLMENLTQSIYEVPELAGIIDEYAGKQQTQAVDISKNIGEYILSLAKEYMPELRASFYISKRAEKPAYIKKKKEESGNITYIYDESHIKERIKRKEKRLKRLNNSLERLREKVKKDLESDDIKTKLIALAVGLIDETYERIGNAQSAEERDHYGVTTWKAKHIKFDGNKAKIKYVGKSGVKQEKEVKNKQLVNALKELVDEKKKDARVFELGDYILFPKHINAYLEPFGITAKDIRGFHANEEMRGELKKVRKGKLPNDPKEKEKKLKEEFKEALEMAAKRVGHNPSTLKNQYLVPSIETNYMKGKFALSCRQIIKTDEISFEEVANLYVDKIYISKRAQELKPEPPTPDVVIEPMDPAIQKAVQKIKSLEPSAFYNVKKIVVHPGGGSGQLGHVEMGPQKDPREIHIFKDRILQLLRQKGKTDPKALEEATERALIEVITHEIGHIGKTRTQEQVIKTPFLGEPEAERQSKEFVGRLADDMEQCAWAPEATPSDKPFGTINEYEPWYSTISQNPFGIFSIPMGLGGGGR